MTSDAPYEQYVHTLAMAYRQFGIDSSAIIASIDHGVARALGESASQRSASGGESREHRSVG